MEELGTLLAKLDVAKLDVSGRSLSAGSGPRWRVSITLSHVGFFSPIRPPRPQSPVCPTERSKVTELTRERGTQGALRRPPSAPASRFGPAAALVSPARPLVGVVARGAGRSTLGKRRTEIKITSKDYGFN